MEDCDEQAGMETSLSGHRKGETIVSERNGTAATWVCNFEQVHLSPLFSIFLELTARIAGGAILRT